MHYAKSTSNHSSVNPKHLKINPVFNYPKDHSSTSVGANCSFTYLHKIVVEIHLQKTMNNGLVGLVLTLEESLSITTIRCDLAIATHARKMHRSFLSNEDSGFLKLLFDLQSIWKGEELKMD